MKKKILITGSTGMVGGNILQLCFNSEEIAEVINVNYQSVSNILHRAIKKMKKNVQKIYTQKFFF